MKDAVRSFADWNVELARGPKERDRQLDQMNRTFADKMTELMSHQVDHIPTFMDLIFISRFLRGSAIRRQISVRTPSTPFAPRKPATFIT